MCDMDGLSITTDAQWINPTGGDWLHIAQCLFGNDLEDTTPVWVEPVDQSQGRERLGRQ